MNFLIDVYSYVSAWQVIASSVEVGDRQLPPLQFTTSISELCEAATTKNQHKQQHGTSYELPFKGVRNQNLASSQLL